MEVVSASASGDGDYAGERESFDSDCAYGRLGMDDAALAGLAAFGLGGLGLFCASFGLLCGCKMKDSSFLYRDLGSDWRRLAHFWRSGWILETMLQYYHVRLFRSMLVSVPPSSRARKM